MSNRNRDERDYEEPYTQGHRNPGAYGQQEASMRQRASQGRDRDIQGSAGGGTRHGQYGGQDTPWREPSGYGGGYGAQQGLQGHGPSSGAGSQGFGPEGYGTPRYEGQRYEGAGYEGYGAQGERYGAQGFAGQEFGGRYGQDMGPSGYGASGYGGPRYGSSERWQETSEMDRQRWASRSQRPYGEEGGYAPSPSSQASGWQGRGSASYGQPSLRQGYGAQGYESQGHGAYELPHGQSPSGSPSYGQQQGFGQQGLGLQEHGQQEHGQQARWGSQMGYRGLGPKNYARSDERIREDLNERLTDADEIDASGITVEVSQGVVTLSGVVDQRWAKHRAEDIAESCSGVKDVHNQIRVQSLSGSQGPSAGRSSMGSSMGTSTGSKSTGATTGGSASLSSGSGSASGSTGSSSASTTSSQGSSTPRTSGHS